MNAALQLREMTVATVPCGTHVGSRLSPLTSQPLLQPVADVRAYLKLRAETNAAVANWQDEEQLACRLPKGVRNEMKAMHRACTRVLDRVDGGASVQSACKAVLETFKMDGWHWNLTTFRQKFDIWRSRKDWLVLVNRAKAGGEWIERDVDLPTEFLALCETRCGEFGRKDGMRQAIISLQRQWKTGRNHHDVEQVIAGYDPAPDARSWNDRDRENLPSGWSEENIRNQVKKRARYTKAVRALLHEGEAAAKDFLPHVLTTKKHLRFMEQITFDDVRFDYLVLNEETGRAEELWALVARETSCRLVLGGVLYPATVTEDAKGKKRKSHLGAKQMKELAGFILQTYPLPPWVCHWLVERGTATLREAVRMALAELFEHRISVRYTTMLGSESPLGYKEEKDGNARGKASHESHNRLFHTQGSFIPGQTGAHYGIRPADLKARCDEAEQIWQDARALPENLRSQVQYPLLTLRQARKFFNKFSLDQNFRTDHKLEGFDDVIEFWSGERWIVADNNIAVPAGADLRKRMESPVERAAKKIREVEPGAWMRPSPEVVCSFLEHSQRRVTVNEKGRIQLDHEGQSLVFEHGGVPLKPGTKALAYHHEDDPEFLHLTDGDGCILGTWIQVGRIGLYDRDALARAMRGNHAALESARAVAGELAAPRIADLEAMRRHNEDLKRFIAVTDAPQASGEIGSTEIARSIAVAPAQKRKAKTHDQQLQALDGDTSDLL